MRLRTSRFAIASALLLGLASGGARADILLSGHQHIGDDESGSYTPSDPVTRLQVQGSPTRFHLSQAATITRVLLDSPVYQSALAPGLVGMQIDGASRAGTFSAVNNSFTFSTPVTLAAGTHTIAPDPGCLTVLGLGSGCPGLGGEHDISFASLTLISTVTTSSRALTRRRHIGDDNEVANDNYLGDYYPDNLEAPPNDVRADIAFSIDANRVLNLLQIYRLRGVNTAPGNHAQVLVDGAQVGVLASDGDPLQVSTLLPLATGSHTLSVISGSLGVGNRDSISWDDIVLQFSAPIGGIPGRFNAVDAGGGAANGVLTTRVAGTTFAPEIVALNLAGTAQLTDYTGAVDVQLLDATDDSGAVDAYGCRATWTLAQAVGSLTFGVSDNGRRAISITHNNALRVARIRVLDPVTGISGCSIDAFAIRPAGFTVQVSHSDSRTAGTGEMLDDTGTGGTKVHRAGQPFTVRATPLRTGSSTAIAGYTGSPTLSIQSTIQGAVAGTLIEGNWFGTGVRQTDTARYSEVGTFNLRASDATFANVDAGDTSAAVREIVGTVGVGRFIPDHFNLVSRNTPGFTPGCGSFSYIGQGFGYATAPIAVIEAVNASEVRTLNYTGSLYRLGAATGTSIYNAKESVSGATVTLDTILLPSPDRSIASTGPGTASVSYLAGANLAVLRSTLHLPFDIELELVVPTITDLDGVQYADPTLNPLSFGATTAGNGIAFTGNGKQMRFGRLYVDNGYGSERLPLDMVYGTAYYVSAAAGWGRNLADSCSVGGAVTLSEGISASTSVVGTPTALVAGQGTLRLAAPNVAGRLKVTLDGVSWLRSDTDANGTYNEPTAPAEATFGQFRQTDKQIYLRETFR